MSEYLLPERKQFRQLIFKRELNSELQYANMYWTQKNKQRQTETRQHERQTSNRNEHEIDCTHPGILSELQAILNGSYFE